MQAQLYMLKQNKEVKMKLTKFINNLLPKSARTRDLAVRKLDEKKIVSGIFFLSEAANNVDIPALMALSSLLLKEGSSCPQTKAAVAKYASQALQLDPKNELARKILLAVEPETNFVPSDNSSDTAIITSKQCSPNNKKSNVVSWQQKEAKILGNKYKNRP